MCGPEDVPRRDRPAAICVRRRLQEWGWPARSKRSPGRGEGSGSARGDSRPVHRDNHRGPAGGPLPHVCRADARGGGELGGGRRQPGLVPVFARLSDQPADWLGKFPGPGGLQDQRRASGLHLPVCKSQVQRAATGWGRVLPVLRVWPPVLRRHKLHHGSFLRIWGCKDAPLQQ